MREKLKSNNGFTLIELVIAIAMLAFIMTAVSALMGNSVLTFRKSKANIAVQNKAQSTYDQLSDSLMQAERIVIHGYLSDTSVDFDTPKSGDATAGTFTDYYFVANEAIKKEYEDAGHVNVKLFSEATDASGKPKPIYVSELIIDTSDVIHGNFSSLTTLNPFTGKSVKITYVGKKDANGDNIYDTNDTVRNTYTFEENYMYYEKRHALRPSSEDYSINWSDNDSKQYGRYCDSIKYLTNSGHNIEGVVAVVDVDNGAIGLTLHFDDKDLNYDTDGMVKIRNSNVLENR